MPHWFTDVDLEGAPRAARQVLEDLRLLLAELNPYNLDPSRSTASVERREVAVHLVHRQDPVADLRLAISEGWTNFYGVFGHDEAYAADPGDDWQAETLQITRDILTSRYTVETQRWRGRPYRTLVQAVGPHEAGSVQLDALRGLVPRPPDILQTTRREIDYDCRGQPEDE